MSKRAHEDPLTGLLNRRSFDTGMRGELARVCRQQTLLSLTMLNIDDFKQLDDKHGHAVGDLALTHFAQLVTGTLRKTDTFGR